jgi:hypothetical protein
MRKSLVETQRDLFYRRGPHELYNNVYNRILVTLFVFFSQKLKIVCVGVCMCMYMCMYRLAT